MGTPAHSPEMIERVISLSLVHSMSEVARLCGFQSRNTVAGILSRARQTTRQRPSLYDRKGIALATDERKLVMLEREKERIAKVEARQRARLDRRNEARRNGRAQMRFLREQINATSERIVLRQRTEHIPSLNVLFADLGRNECKFPTTEAPFLFCALPAQQGSSYCDCHREVAYRRESASRRTDIYRRYRP